MNRAKQLAKLKPGEIAPITLNKGEQMPQCSNLGRVKSCRGVIFTPSLDASGYATVRIKGKVYMLAALICRIFHGPAPTPEHTVNHIDLDRSNNKPENLEWSSKAEQVQHSYANNTNRRSGAPQTSTPIKAKPVGGTDEQVRSFGSRTKAADDLKVNPGHISACCRKKLKTATAKDKTKWTFWYDTEAAPPACLEGERWAKVVAGDGMHEVVAPQTLAKRLSWPRVSSLGRYQDCKGVIKEPIPEKSKYARVQAFGKMYSFHGLVARAFNGPVPEGCTVDHINNNPSNNHLSNLQYLSRSEQVKKSYATNHNRKSSAPKRSKPVIATPIDDEGNKGEAQKFDSAEEAARELHINHQSISKHCLSDEGKTYTNRRTKRKWSFCFDADASEPLAEERFYDYFVDHTVSSP